MVPFLHFHPVSYTYIYLAAASNHIMYRQPALNL